MIKLIRGRLRWDSSDQAAMTRILGPDAASKGQVAPIPSVLKLAERFGLSLSPRCAQLLERAREERRQLRSGTSEVIYHSSLTSRLYAHQVEALTRMDARRAYLLADEPGVGKTPAAIMWTEKHMTTRALILTLNSAKRQFLREIERWTVRGFPMTLVEGTLNEQREQVKRDGWVVGHYESLVNAPDDLNARPWDVIVIDECQQIRNHRIQRSKNLFALDATYRLAMSGTPFNYPDEFWSILHFLYPDVYTSYWTYFSLHVAATPRFFGGFDIHGTRRPKLLRWELEPFMIRRTKREVYPHLPPVTTITREIDLPRTYQREYDQLKTEMLAEIQTRYGDRKRIPIKNVLVRTTRLRQYLVDPGLIGGRASLKYPEIENIIRDLDGPPVIFTSFRQASLALRDFLEHKKYDRVGIIHGDVPPGQRDRIQRRFVRGKLDALIAVTSTGGTALNLGRYGYVVFLDLPWSRMDVEQAEGRVDRPEEGTGRTVPTTSYRIICRNTYEVNLLGIVEKKGNMFDQVFVSTDDVQARFG